MTAVMACGIIDSPTAKASLIHILADPPTFSHFLYLDLEGTNLSRLGSFSIVELFVLSQNYVYLIDVRFFGETTFSIESHDGLTLKDILESSDTPKVFFDVRNDIDVLYSHFKISLPGVQNIQLLENAQPEMCQ